MKSVWRLEPTHVVEGEIEELEEEEEEEEEELEEEEEEEELEEEVGFEPVGRVHRFPSEAEIWLVK